MVQPASGVVNPGGAGPEKAMVDALRLTLLCHAATAATRAGAFADNEPAEAASLAKAAALAGQLPRAARVLASPARAAMQTAQALGLAAWAEPALGDADPGAWRGRALGSFAGAEAAALAAMLADPFQGPPGGESAARVLDRVGAWMDGLEDGSVLAITHAAVLRAAAVHALGAGAASLRHVDAPPLAVLRLTRHGGRWMLRLG